MIAARTATRTCRRPCGKPNGTWVNGAVPEDGLPTHSHRPDSVQFVIPSPLLYMSSVCCSVSAPEKKTSGILRYSALI